MIRRLDMAALIEAYLPIATCWAMPSRSLAGTPCSIIGFSASRADPRQFLHLPVEADLILLLRIGHGARA